jgi:hypothetical protein
MQAAAEVRANSLEEVRAQARVTAREELYMSILIY